MRIKRYNRLLFLLTFRKQCKKNLEINILCQHESIVRGFTTSVDRMLVLGLTTGKIRNCHTQVNTNTRQPQQIYTPMSKSRSTMTYAIKLHVETRVNKD